jgi:aminopeptidase N
MKKIYLKDYQAPEFEILSINLFFDLHDDFCQVRSQMRIKKLNAKATDLFLDGEDLELTRIELNDTLPKYEIQSHGLKILNVPSEFSLEIETKIKPNENSTLSGLYRSGDIYVTQCEAQGFRRITYFLDRPDVMTKYNVTITADQKKFPVLLSNGNRLAQKTLPNGRHQVSWSDPFKKPSYLFALVAGDLGVLRSSFTTINGRKVELEIYAAHGKQERCQHAMDSLKKAMRWDEERFGREYDLDTYMIVAADDFNAGAMENKGLNIFNSKLVFADAKTATDADYYNIESVIAHEYFHNWTGNRVTLRDWFHLSLKEGLTVFRDQEFSMDMSSRAMVRIDNVADLRASQFSEDAGPNAHPIRPASCYAVDNFYTSTIYEKGAEVIRMMQTMVGRPGFRRGMDLYFQRYDGKAVIIEDFANAIAEPNQQNWEQFKLWYSQAGTPEVQVEEKYDDAKKTYTLTLSQSCPLTSQERAENLQKKPFHIPLVIGLLDQYGKDLPLKNDQVVRNTEGQSLLHLRQEKETFVFRDIPHRPVLSLNRQFSAPVRLKWDASLEDLLFLMKKDSDAFNRWEASQKIYQQAFSALLKNPNEVPPSLIEAFSTVINDTSLDPDLKAKLMTLPSDDYLAQLEPVIVAPAFLKARQAMEKAFALATAGRLEEIYHEFHGKNLQSRDPKDFGRRRLKNTALMYLSQLPEKQKLVKAQFDQAQIMTDQQSALAFMVEMQNDLRDYSIQKFYDQWKSEFLVINKWFAVQAASTHPQTFLTVQRLMSHPDFTLKNPNKVYALLRTFGDNLVIFHNPELDTYRFMADQILEIDRLNPYVAARIAGCFDVWTRLPEAQAKKARAELERMVSAGLSKNTHEIISKNLEA